MSFRHHMFPPPFHPSQPSLSQPQPSIVKTEYTPRSHGDIDRANELAIRRLERFIQIKQRGETRAAYGRNRYPSHINKPKNKIERQEYSDYRWLDRWKKRVSELNETERVLYNEIMSWKAEKRNQLTRLQRLTEIKRAGEKRYLAGGRKYPRNHRKPKSEEERIEHNDYRWLSRLRERESDLTPQEKVIYDELMTWKPPAKKQMTRLERLTAIRNRGKNRSMHPQISVKKSEDSKVYNEWDSYYSPYGSTHLKPKVKEVGGMSSRDYYWLAQLKKKTDKLTAEELLLYEEIQAWKKKRKRSADSGPRKRRMMQGTMLAFDQGLKSELKRELKMEHIHYGSSIVSLPPMASVASTPIHVAVPPMAVNVGDPVVSIPSYAQFSYPHHHQFSQNPNPYAYHPSATDGSLHFPSLFGSLSADDAAKHYHHSAMHSHGHYVHLPHDPAVLNSLALERLGLLEAGLKDDSFSSLIKTEAI